MEVVTFLFSDAAIHFGAFLQLKDLLQGTDSAYGSIERTQLQEQFSIHYQPRYKSCLVLPELLSTLRRFGVVKQTNHKKRRPSSSVFIIKHPDPASELTILFENCVGMCGGW